MPAPRKAPSAARKAKPAKAPAKKPNGKPAAAPKTARPRRDADVVVADPTLFAPLTPGEVADALRTLT